MRDFITLRMAWRLTRSRRYGPLARFMSLASAAGITLGVAALIIGLSAMNGFERELENRVLAVIPAGTLSSGPDGFMHLDDDLRELGKDPSVSYAEPASGRDAIIGAGGNFAPVRITGIKEGTHAAQAMTRFSGVKAIPEKDAEGTPSIVLGRGAAKALGVKEGSTVTVMSASDGSIGGGGTSAKVAGIFNIGGQMDGMLAFMRLDDAVEYSGLKAPNLILLGCADLLKAPDQLYFAAMRLHERSSLTTWMDTQGKLYNDIQLVRGIMYLAMILVMAVACFNIIANLLMSVSEKSREIAMLRTMGATRSTVVRLFTLMGFMQGARGTLLGAAIGSFIAAFLMPIMKGIESIFGIKFLNPDVYFIDFIPSRLDLGDVLLVAATALVMSVLASLFPAIRASRIEPARELNS
jgi:lipoprotein-releasing system permease protein